MPTHERERPWAFLPVAVMFWAAVVVVDVIGDLSGVYVRGEVPPMAAMIRMWALFWGPWIVVASIALRWVVHIRPTPGSRARWLVRHAVVGCVVVAVHLTLCAALFQTFAQDGLSWSQRALEYAIGLGHRDLALYAGLVAVVTAWTLWLDAVAAELHSARIEADARRAKLEALRAQLRPHFLFNALNSVGALVRRGDRDEALEALDRLGQLLRAGFDPNEPVMTTLQTELDRIEHYLDLERVRFQDRLRVSWAVDRSLLEVPVPALVLQPLVENAVKHGLGRTTRPVAIEIVARRDPDGRLELSVWNDAPDTLDEDVGVGLSNTRARLALLYRDAASLVVSDSVRGGFEATMRLPTNDHRGQPAHA
ncbi:MAG: histidine kinase [Gemmatimonadota bacterium]